MDLVLVPPVVPGADEHVVKPIVPDHVRRPEQPLAVFVPIRRDRKRLFVPRRLGERLRRRVQQVLARVPGEVDRQNVRDGENMPRSVRSAHERMVVDTPGLLFARFRVENLGEPARFYQRLVRCHVVGLGAAEKRQRHQKGTPHDPSVGRQRGLAKRKLR